MRPVSVIKKLAGAFILCSITLFFSFNSSLAATPQPKDPMEMTLAEAINVALRMNRSVKSAYLSRVVEKFSLRVSQDKFNPNVDFSAATNTASDGEKFESSDTGVGANIAITKMIETGGVFTFSWAGSDLWTTSDLTGTKTWTVGFTQPLLKGAGIDYNTASVTLAELAEQSNLLTLKDSISATVLSTILAFRSYAQTTRELEIIKSSLKRAKDLLETNKFLISVGRMAANELIQTESDVANQEFAYETALNRLDSARLSLLKILNLDKSTIIIPREEGEPAAVHPDFDLCLKTAFENRSDFLNANMGIDRAKISLALAENDMLWALDFAGSYSITDTDNTQAWNMGLALSIPIYGDLTREQGLVSAQISLEQTQLSLDETTENITIEVQDAIREVETTLKQVGLAQRARELSEKKLEVEGEKLKVGRTTNFQMVTFQNDLVTAQNAELNANISFRNALTSLDNILGTTLNTWKIDYNKENDRWPGK